MSGTVSIVPSSVLSISNRGGSFVSGWRRNNNDGSTDADFLIAILQSTGGIDAIEHQDGLSHSESIVFGFDFGSAIFVLDTGAVNFNDLPSGIIFKTMNFSITFGASSGAASGSSIFSLSGQPIITNAWNSGGTVTYDLMEGASTLSPISLIGKQFGFSFNFGSLNAGGTLQNFAKLDAWSLTGTYDIIKSESTFNPIIQNRATPVYPGSKIIINSYATTAGITSGPGTALDGVSQIKLNYTHPIKGSQEIIIKAGNQPDPINPEIIQDPTLIINGVEYVWVDLIFIEEEFTLWFYLPDFPDGFVGPVIVSIIGNGRQFSGSVSLGTLNVLFANASGIYTLDETKINDTVYLRSGFTTDIKPILFSFVDEEEDNSNNFYSMLSYPRRILELGLENIDNDSDREDIMLISTQRVIISTVEVEIPSPFVQTGFLP